MLGRGVIAGDDVAAGGTHVAEEIDEAGSGGGGSATGEIRRGGADEEHLRAVDAKANDDEQNHGYSRAVASSSTVDEGENAEQGHEDADHWRAAAAEEAVGCPAGEIGAGGGADGDDEKLQRGLIDVELLGFHEVSDTPVEEAIAAGVEQAKREAE